MSIKTQMEELVEAAYNDFPEVVKDIIYKKHISGNYDAITGIYTTEYDEYEINGFVTRFQLEELIANQIFVTDKKLRILRKDYSSIPVLHKDYVIIDSTDHSIEDLIYDPIGLFWVMQLREK